MCRYYKKIGKSLRRNDRRDYHIVFGMENLLIELIRYTRNKQLYVRRGDTLTYGQSGVVLTSLYTVEKILTFLLLHLIEFVQEDGYFRIYARIEKPFINIRIQECKLKSVAISKKRLPKVISLLQHWMKQYGYLVYKINNYGVCDVSIYILLV